MSLSGACRCGACRYTLDYQNLPVAYACHCLDCQTMSGASFTLQMPILLSRLHTDGNFIGWAHPNSRGDVSTQRFCAVCKTRLNSTNDGRPTIALIRAGTLDESANIVPAVHMWTKRKQAWIELPDNAEADEEAIPAERLKALFAPNYS